MLITKSVFRSAGALGMTLLAASVAFCGALAPQNAKSAPLSTTQGQRLLATRTAHFLENKGQWDSEARFLARVNELDVWFTDQGIRYDNHLKAVGKGRIPHQAVSMSFAGGRAATPVASHKLRGHTDFLTESAKALNVRSYGELLSKGVYPGVDFRSYFQANQPRYDFIVAPGARTSTIKLAFKGDNGLSIKDGKLRISTMLGGFANGKPVAYQTMGNRRVPVPARWALLDKHTAGFVVGAYDASKTLVIDPLIYGSFVGGNNGADEAHAVVADDSGGVFVTGITYTPFFPTQKTDNTGLNYQGGGDAFLYKLQGDAYDLDYSAFIGGNSFDSGQFLRRDAAGNVWLAGLTASTVIPGATRNNVQILSCEAPTVTDAPDDGAYRLITPSGGITAELRYNATAGQIQQALIDAGAPVLSVTALRQRPAFDFTGTIVPSAKFAITFSGDGDLGVLNDFLRATGGDPTVDNTGVPFVEGVTPAYKLASPSIIRRYGSVPTSGTFTITIRTVNGTTITNITTAAIAYDATADVIAKAITDAGVPAAATGGPLNSTNNVANTSNQVVVTLTPAAPTTASLININSTQLIRSFDQTRVERKIGYHADRDTDLFVMRFTVSSTGAVSSPLDVVGKTMIFGSNDIDRFSNFDVLQTGDGTAVDFLISGSTLQPLRQQGIVDPQPFPITGGALGFLRVGFMSRYVATLGNNTSYTKVSPSASLVASADARQDQPIKDLPYVTTPSRGASVDVRGAVFDPAGNVVIAGTAYLGTNATTSKTSSVFYTGNNTADPLTQQTLPNIFNYEGFNNGNDARLTDLFVRRIGSGGNTIWSGLLGGTANDEAGGYAIGLDAGFVNTGSAVAVDRLNNVYVVGVSTSFDFERTRGVFGEVPADGDTDVTVTKISADGQSILYSTNLRGVGNQVPNVFTPLGETVTFYSSNIPAGISIDGRNYAYITGNLRAYDVEFPPIPTPPAVPDPVEPVTSTLSRGGGASDQIFLPTNPTGGIPDATYDSPTGTEFPTTEGYLTVLNDTATNIVFATFLGGRMDDRAYAPYVDTSSDVWVMGFTDNKRTYSRPKLTTPPVIYRSNGGLPGALITPLAFKQSSDTESNPSFQTERMAYGLFSSVPHPNGTYSGPDFVPFPLYSRDGFVDKFRIDLASVSGLSFNPPTIPGGPIGSGVSTTGTVNLSQGAPSGGGQIVVTITSGTGAASFSATNDAVRTLTIPIIEGQTSAQFQVYSRPVDQTTPVTVRATFQGTFKETSFQVVPYLQRVQLSSDTVVGGDPNPFSGTVTLSAPAPTGGIQVVLTVEYDTVQPNQPAGSDPLPATVPARIKDIQTIPFVIPAGQTSAQFDIDTDGVSHAEWCHRSSS